MDLGYVNKGTRGGRRACKGVLSGQRHLINMSAVPVDLCLSLKKLHTHTHTHTDTNKIQYNIVNIRSQGM